MAGCVQNASSVGGTAVESTKGGTVKGMEVRSWVYSQNPWNFLRPNLHRHACDEHPVCQKFPKSLGLRWYSLKWRHIWRCSFWGCPGAVGFSVNRWQIICFTAAKLQNIWPWGASLPFFLAIPCSKLQECPSILEWRYLGLQGCMDPPSPHPWKLENQFNCSCGDGKRRKCQFLC